MYLYYKFHENSPQIATINAQTDKTSKKMFNNRNHICNLETIANNKHK